MEKPIRILHVLGRTDLGGAESRIMDLYRHIDRNRVQFDFLVHTGEDGYFDQEIQKLGGRIFRVPRFRLYNYVSYRRAVKEFFKEHHEFGAVQGHMTSTAAIYLPIAKREGISVTIAHARSAGVDQGMKGSITKWMRRNLAKRADYLFTCSELAGISVFGKRAVEEGRTIFIPNAIDCPKFVYHPQKREEMRRELGISNCYVIGHVGRFHYAKNHEYLLRIFARLHELEQQKDPGERKDYVLLLLGEGGGMQRIRELAQELSVEDKVYFLGNHSNAYDYYQAMDFFVYPSRFEGLPGTVVEAQVSGLRCLVSDTICKEVAVTELVSVMNIEKAPELWASYIRKNGEYERRDYAAEMRQAGFDVNTQAEAMMEFYESGQWKGV